MATRKTKLKLSLNTKIFVIIAIIIGAALVLSGVPQTAKFIASTTPAVQTITKQSTASYSESITLDFGKEYTRVSRVIITARHGGAFGCWDPYSDFNFYAYDVNGKETYLGRSNKLKPQGEETYLLALTTNLNVVSIKGIWASSSAMDGISIGKTTCPYLDFLKATVYYAPPKIWRLTIAKAGTSTGTVTSSDGKINCGSDCTEDYIEGTTVTLKATPAVGTFVGWSGACSGTSTTCTVSMSFAKTVTATFNAPVSLLANGASCTANSQCNSGYCLSGKCTATTVIPCGSTTCNGATQKCCTSVNKCYLKTLACPM